MDHEHAGWAVIRDSLYAQKEKMTCQKPFHSMICLLLSAMFLSGCAGAQSKATRTPPLASPTMAFASTATPTLTRDVPVPNSYKRFDLGRDLYVRQIREGVFVVTHAFPWPANSLIVEMENSDLVLVGTPYTPDATRDVLNWIETQFGKRKLVAINTGYHVDNLGGNEALVEKGIPVYGSDLTAKLLLERGEQTRAVILKLMQGDQDQPYYQAHAKMSFVAPTHLFRLDDGLKLDFGKETMQVYYPGPSQAPDKVVVYFPSKKVLFGSCMILGGNSVGNTSDADLKEWPNAVRKLSQFDADVVVPGHGDRLDRELIEHTLRLLGVAP